jgi:tight adherence protein B
MSLNLTTVDLIVTACVFGFVLAVWFVVLFAWWAKRSGRAAHLEHRLGIGEAAEEKRTLRLWHDGEEVTTEVPGEDKKLTLGQKMDRLTREAELGVPVQTLILGLTGIAGIFFLLLLVTLRSPLPGIALGIAIFIFFGAYLKGRIARRVSRFERQLVDALELAARSLRAGHPLMGSFRLIAEEIPAPVGQVFGEICQEQSLGLGIEEALRNAAAENPNADLKVFATSVIIQMRSGGNLADMMERISHVIRDRMRLNRRVRVLTAQTQFSKRILVALPFVIFVVLNVINQNYMRPFYETNEGQIALACAGAGILMGMWIMSRLSILKY